MKNQDNNIFLTIEKLMKDDKENNTNNNKINNDQNSIINNNKITDNINPDISKNSYQSMFSIVSKSDCDLNNELNKSDSNKDLGLNRINSNISQMSSTSNNSNNNKTISFWEAIKLKLNNIKNQIIFNYNIFSPSYYFNYNSPKLAKEIKIFDEKYLEHEQLLNKLKNIPWFSYRKDFDQIKEQDNIYTSDAGWGCMLRVSQMIFAQGLCKIYSITKLNDFINQYISYFYDNNIPLKYMCKNKQNLSKSMGVNENNIINDFEVIDKEKDLSSFIDLSTEIIKGLENMCERKSNKEYITPPFSIRNLIKVQKHINKEGKKAGEWFSNYDTLRLIHTINNEMIKNNDCDFKIFNFNEGVIYIEDIINECFEEYNYTDNSEEFEVLRLSSQDNLIPINDDIDSIKYTFNNKIYKLKNKFIIFVSVRHGLYSLDEEMYNDVLKIFDIETNIGFIGGKNTRAFYFIGKCENNVIFLDPHFVQETIPLIKLGTISVKQSYIPNDIFYMPINELSPSFSIGFAVKNVHSFKKLMMKLNSSDYFINQEEKRKKHSIYKNYLFTVKNWHKYVIK